MGRAVQKALAGISLAAASMLPGCEDLGAPQRSGQPEESGYRGIFDAESVKLEFRLETPDGGFSPLRLVATNLSHDPSTQQVHAWVAVRNAGGETLPGPDAIVVGDFVPEDVRPVNAGCFEPCPAFPCSVGADCPPCPATCAFDHRGTYGEDGVLAPDETSEPVEWIFHDPSGESFAFRARFQGRPSPPESGVISGVVFDDVNGDGRRQDDERGIPGASVSLLFGNTVQITETDELGRYAFQVSEPGLYELVWEPGRCPPSTPIRLQVLILRRPDGTLSGFARGDFGCFAAGDVRIPVAGIVFVDANRNGVHDRGESGLPGILVIGSTPNCPTLVAIEARTDEHGRYSMSLVLCEPPFVVQREPIPGYVDTSPNPLVFALRDPARLLEANFGVAPEDSTRSEYFVEGVVFRDGNRNGARDADEPGVGGVELTASGFLCLTPVSAHTRTDESGHYRMRGNDVHCPLPWIVQRHGPWLDTTPNPVLLREPPPDGGDTFHVDFGVVEPDSVPPLKAFAVEGTVFADLDRDGAWDRGEPGIADVELQLVSPCDLFRAARTDLRGHFRFEPEVVQVCPVEAVWLSHPAFPELTTPNPAPVDPSQIVGGVAIVNFGVAPRRNQP